MEYYHVYINSYGDEIQELDLPREKLVKYIVAPFNKKVKFMCKGVFVDPSDIEAIRIIKTENPSSEIISETKKQKGLVGLLIDDWSILEEKGKDVTRNFIVLKTSKKETMRKYTLPSKKRVFIVHGTDHTPAKELKAILEEIGLNPIILHEQPSGSRTIIEKLEEYSQDVGFAIILLTPDDALVPTAKTFKVDEKQGTVSPMFIMPSLKPLFRARQNVILEFGYFIARIGRKRVCCLYKENTELPFDKPSDMQGIVYIPFKNSVKEAKDEIIKELQAANFKVRS
jgi:predicted nucleotide-binding protein